MMITITFKVFSILNDHFQEGFNLELESPKSIEQVKHQLQQLKPDVAPILDCSRFASDDAFLDADHVLQNDQTLFILPPSSGG